MSNGMSFGGFFKSKRKPLAPTLREFCRRNGFDAANISRLERGVNAPPQAASVLEGYAKALKLEEGSADRQRLFELAAAETGRIPADMLEAKQKLPGLFLQLRAEAQGLSGWVNARHLAEWAGTLDARATLPRLVRRLVQATGRGVKRIDKFESEEQTQRPGWDGIVEAGAGDVFVPEGTSGWEMGVDKEIRQKFEDDLEKRNKNSLGLDRAKTTFIFVTPRKKWQSKAERGKKIAVGEWKEVRIYDSATLEQWLEQAPAVDAWLAERLGLKPEGVISFDDYWANLQALTKPSLAPEVYLASRAAQVKELERWLFGEEPAEGEISEAVRWFQASPGVMAIESRSPVEALDFLVAFSQDSRRIDQFGARALIVEERNAWRRLAATQGGLLLVPHPTLSIESELVAEAVRKGNRVLLLSTQEPREHIQTIRLARVYRYDLETALTSSGMDRPTAQKSAKEGGGSLTVLKRLIAVVPGTQQPEWSQPQEAAQLAPILLAGGWNENSDGDREALERLAGRPYSAIADVVSRWLKVPDAPIARVGSRISLVSRDDSWFLLAPFLSPTDENRFEQVALDVLAENDASFELPPERRWEASFQRKAPKYSPVLRQGLVETLALLASRPTRQQATNGTPSRSERIVRTLLNKQGWLRWASLSYQLPLLAEAGPDAFLEAIERDLKQSAPALGRVFEQGGDPLFTSMPHTGVLWALENLSWNSELLGRVSLVLADLDTKKLNSRSGNTPFLSLSEIFMPWYPQTTAPVSERIAVLRMLMKKCPGGAWRLLLSLLPNSMSMATDIHRPDWRDWALNWSANVTQGDYWQQVEACGDMLVDGMGDDVERWKTLIKQVENLPAEARDRFVEKLIVCAARVTDPDIRRDVSDTIRVKVAWHRRYSTAKGARPEAFLSQLEQVQTAFEPQDLVRKNAWLFGMRWQALERMENNEERLDQARREAVAAIISLEGWPGVLRLVRTSEAPEEVGQVLAVIQPEPYDSQILPGLLASLDQSEGRFARGYSWGRFREEGWDWIERLKLSAWSVEEAGSLLLVLKFERQTWEYADRLGPEVASWYWQRTRSCSMGDDKQTSEYVIGKFLEQKRPSAALGELRMALHHKLEFEPSLLMDILQCWLDAEVPKSNPHSIHDVKYDVDKVFEVLQKLAEQENPALDIQRLATLEWACLGLLDGYPSSPVILHRLLRDNPEFFVQVLGLCFRPKDVPPKDESDFTPRERQAAGNAYRLLMSWESVPGTDDRQTVDEERLLAWTKKARSLAKDIGLLEICDSRIGQVLAHAPPEADGSWPCIPVRDALEDIASESEDVLDGFGVGIFNKRGMVSRSLREGGEKERTLAAKLKADADASKFDWPQTAAALRKVAYSYEEYARREDLSAELE